MSVFRAGDPCSVCGSTRTGWDASEGGYCLHCLTVTPIAEEERA